MAFYKIELSWWYGDATGTFWEDYVEVNRALDAAEVLLRYWPNWESLSFADQPFGIDLRTHTDKNGDKYLDYTLAELAGVISRNLPNHGKIYAWSNPWVV